MNLSFSLLSLKIRDVLFIAEIRGYLCVELYFIDTGHYPSKHEMLTYVVLILVHRLRCYPNIKPKFGLCRVFIGYVQCYSHCVQNLSKSQNIWHVLQKNDTNSKHPNYRKTRRSTCRILLQIQPSIYIQTLENRRLPKIYNDIDLWL